MLHIIEIKNNFYIDKNYKYIKSMIIVMDKVVVGQGLKYLNQYFVLQETVNL